MQEHRDRRVEQTGRTEPLQPVGRGRTWGLLTLAYAAAIVYGSLIIGPAGFHHEPIGVGEALRRFASIRWVFHDSDQRADWIANLIMLAPLGYLLRGLLGRSGVSSRLAMPGAIALGVTFVLAVKFAQLYVPPRTVTLNYVVAQSIGVGLGVWLQSIYRSRLRPRIEALARNGDGLVILLGAYTAWLFAYFLTPFDIVLSAAEWHARASQLPIWLAEAPGPGQPPSVRALLILADGLATVPVGMFLAVTFRSRSAPFKLAVGFALMALVEVASLFVLSATPFGIALVYRTAGVGLGLLFMELIKGRDLRKRHYALGRYVPAAMLAYIALLAFAGGLADRQWVTLDQATHMLEPRQFLPFWNYYIVSKAHAARSLVAHAFMFAPVGVMIWLRRGFWAKGVVFSAGVAFTLSMLIEVGRWLKPGLRPDFSDPLIAAVAAAMAFKAMPFLWRMFEREATLSTPIDQYIAALRTGTKHGHAASPSTSG